MNYQRIKFFKNSSSFIVSSNTRFYNKIKREVGEPTNPYAVGKPIEYFGFKYYPRYPDEKEEPYTPSKLFLVKRLRPLAFQPGPVKQILEEIGLGDKDKNYIIVKNIPEVNSLLYKVKHIIKISPITFPNGEPTEADIGSTFLKENGELVIFKSLKPSEEVVKATAIEDNKETKMDGETIRKQQRLKWIRHY